MGKRYGRLVSGNSFDELSEPDSQGHRTAIVIWGDSGTNERATTATFNRLGGCISHMMGWRLPLEYLDLDIAPENPFFDAL